jgi:hypothetical protein
MIHTEFTRAKAFARKIHIEFARAKTFARMILPLNSIRLPLFTIST